ncbi:Armadillo-type fold [Phytophthora cactorum]|nr:Armadillo-type fold [Phytophthora cactorum]
MTSMPANGAMKLGELPALEDVPQASKLKLCCVLYDFTDMRKQVREKEAKRNALLQIVEYISAGKVAWDPSVVADLLECVGANIFRHLGRSSNPSTINANGNVEAAPEDDEPMLEPSWPHMQLVYEILLRFVLSKEVDSRTAKEYFSKKFMIKLLNLFDSEDPRERDYLKVGLHTILHRIYGKSMALRSFIRRSINDMFYTFVYETESLQGVGELLEILGSIINGFALPLKPEHQNFLERALIPLHTFVEKDPQTAEPIIMGLLKYWPVTASAKEVSSACLFATDGYLSAYFVPERARGDHRDDQMEQFAAVMRPLFLRISQAVCSSHFQVSQRALYLWNNEALNHWHSTVQTLTYNVLKLFMEMDSQLFDQCSAQFEEREGR